MQEIFLTACTHCGKKQKTISTARKMCAGCGRSFKVSVIARLSAEKQRIIVGVAE